MGEFNKKYNSGEKRNFSSKNFDRKPRFDNRNSEQESHHSEQKTEDFIFGLRPVMEAIEAGKPSTKFLYKVVLQGEIYADLKKLLKKNTIFVQTPFL